MIVRVLAEDGSDKLLYGWEIFVWFHGVDRLELGLLIAADLAKRRWIR